MKTRALKWGILVLALYLVGCDLTPPPRLSLSLANPTLLVREGEEATLVVRVEGQRVREVEVGVEFPFPPPPQKVAPSPSGVEVVFRFRAPQGSYQGRVVAQGDGLRREAPFSLEVLPGPEVALEGVVYVTTAGVSPQALAGSQLHYCPTGCPGVPLGGGWYRMEGLAPLGTRPSLPDRRVQAMGGEGEPLFPQQWNLPLAGFPEAWPRGDGRGVVVAVVDTGVLQGHPDLREALLPGLDLVDGDTDPEDAGTYHGSHVAGIVAASWNGEGMAGASQSSILPIRILDASGNGRESDLMVALRWAAGIPVPGLPQNPYPAKVINLSLAGEGSCSAPLQQALDEVRALGVLVVAAAGNFARDYRSFFPANCRGVLAVGAVGPQGELAGYSNRGAPLLAPGGNGGQGVLGPTWSQGFGYRTMQGTSQAAPHVAAAASLLFSRGGTLEGVEGAILAGALPTPAGNLLRADRALEALEGSGVALQVEGELALAPGQEGSIPVQVLSSFPVQVEVRPEGGLSAYLSPNPAQGQAFLRVRAGSGLAPGQYTIGLEAGVDPTARATVEVEVREGAKRVVLEACADLLEAGGCQVLILPQEGGPFRLEAAPGLAYHLLAFLDTNGNSSLDPEEPRAGVRVAAPARGVRLVLQ
ncbi:S8 family serine peptidase [Thermus caldifontis]|uniref:S8 family serine peptidase n=1 Tax=Thermus caldifontis TaxID=1930763 RepID=UPI001F07D514|nr:S8 family serine peptidase [Thermus caldifontis]